MLLSGCENVCSSLTPGVTSEWCFEKLSQTTQALEREEGRWHWTQEAL